MVRSSGLGQTSPGAHGHHGSVTRISLLPLWRLVLSTDPAYPNVSLYGLLPCPRPSSLESSPQCHSAQRSAGPGTTALFNGLLISNYSVLTRLV